MASPSPAATIRSSVPPPSSAPSPFATWRSTTGPVSFPSLFSNTSPMAPFESTATAPITPTPGVLSDPIFTLHGTYSRELRDRPEWARIGPVITALGTIKEGTPQASKRDFYFELMFQSAPTRAFAGFGPIKAIELSALLLTPDSFQVANRRQTGATIKNFAETNKPFMDVIVYLMNSSGPVEQQAEAIQSLSALHHCLSLGFSDAPPVIVVSDAAYLTDCVESYMKSLRRAKALGSTAYSKTDNTQKPSLFGPATKPPSGLDLTPRALFGGNITETIKTEHPDFTQPRK